MKNGFLSILLILSVLVSLQLSAERKSDDFNKTKRAAEDAFAELDGKTPDPKPAGRSDTKTGKSRNQSAEVAEKSGGEFDSITDDDFFPFAVLKGKGIGKDEKSAKMSALAELENSIVVNVSSQLKMSQEEKDGRYSQYLEEDIRTGSDVFLKGVRFTEPRKTEDGFELFAFMTEKSVINTISYLLKTMPSDIDSLSREKFDDVLTMIYLSYSLLYAVSDSQVRERQKYINILNKLKAEIEKSATFGSIYFSARTGVTGKVEIAGKEHDLNKKIHLKPGSYDFTVKSSGYKKLNGKFSVARGDRKFVEVILIPENSGRKEVFLRVDGQVRMIDDIEKTLLDFGIVPTQNGNLPHQIVVVLKETVTKVDKYEKYILEVDVHTFKNGRKFKITHYAHRPFFVTSGNKNEKVREESRKVSVAVVKKFLSSINLDEFFAE